MSLSVYLDQNKWIRLLQQREGTLTDSRTENILSVIERTSDERSAEFPLSLITIRETAASHNRRNRRSKMFEFMRNISKMNALAPYDITMGEEKNRCLAENSGREYDMYEQVRGKGIPFMYAGHHWSVEADDEWMISALEEFAISDEAFEEVLENSSTSGLGKDRWDDEKLAELEEIRKHHDDVLPSNEIRRRVELAGYFRDQILFKMWLKFAAAGLDLDPLDVNLYAYSLGDSEGDDALELFKQFPATYTYVSLSISRDLQKQRPIQQNDIDDLMALSVAIPYCDVVVTENMWAHEAKANDLDEIYDTTVLSDLEDLIPILEETEG